MGISVNNFYAGRFLHVDDIRTLATSEAFLKCQVEFVEKFTYQNLLKLNVSKCEIVLFSKQQSCTLPVCDVDGSIMPAGDVGKCLGYWWKGDLSASRSVEENIQKTCHAFFHFSSIGDFQSDISPLSSREVIKSCMMPVLLYGSENWTLTDALIEKLEAFQGELVKWVFEVPQNITPTLQLLPRLMFRQ